MSLWPFRRRFRLHRWDPSRPLIQWSKRGDDYTIRDSYAGTLCFGASGAGKTSGPGRALARAFLEAGYGLVVHTCRPGDGQEWLAYAEAAGRADDVIWFGPGHGHVYDVLDDELAQSGGSAAMVENIVALIAGLSEVSRRGVSGPGGGASEPYWEQAGQQLQRNVVSLLALARGRVSIPDIYKCVVSAPTSFEQLRSEDWRASSFCYQMLQAADRRELSEDEKRDLELVADYFLAEIPGLSDKTRSVIFSTLTSLLDRLNRGVLRSLFAGTTTITPRAVEDGAILILDMPIKRYGEIGQLGQVLFRQAFMRSIERRAIGLETRPVSLWADEAQFYLTEADFLFATTCRGSQVANVVLTQNMPNIVAALDGGAQSRSQANSLVANFSTKIFCAQADAETNQFAAELIGRERQVLSSGNSSRQAGDGMDLFFGERDEEQISGGFSEAWEYEIQPNAFSKLRTGGPHNQWQIDAVVFRNGREFAEGGRSWLSVTFLQDHA